jgi:tetratricopeptide (TPR) repeat protein
VVSFKFRINLIVIWLLLSVSVVNKLTLNNYFIAAVVLPIPAIVGADCVVESNLNYDKRKTDPNYPLEILRQIEQAKELRAKWQLIAAEAQWQSVLKEDNANIEALLGLADIARVRFDYSLARDYLDRAIASALVTMPLNNTIYARVNAAYGTLYLTLEESDRAAYYFQQAHQVAPQYHAAIVGQAGVALLQRDYQLAEKRLTALLQQEPERIEAQVVLAKVYLEENLNNQAAQQSQRVLELDKYNVDALATLCVVRVAEKKPEAVRKLAKTVLELNPYNAGVRRLLSQYLNGKKAYQLRLLPEAQALISRAESFKDNGRWQTAAILYRQAVALEPRAMKALLGWGACELKLGNYAQVVTLAEQALVLDNESALAHLQLSLAHSAIHEQARTAFGAPDWRKLYQDNYGREKVPDLENIFINYDRLSPQEQGLIEQSVLPLAGYLKELKRKGGKHYLLGIDKKLSEIEGYESLESRVTMDGRYYASVRGVGGLITVSGIEYLDVALRGGFNTIAHEFAHQIHTTVLAPAVVEKIRQLYDRAVKENRILDYYAAANEWEYFAQGYEAYISQFKRPNAGVTARHTRQELQQKDPQLLALLVQIATQKLGELETNTVVSTTPAAR